MRKLTLSQTGFVFEQCARAPMLRQLRGHEYLARLWVGSPVGGYHKRIALDMRELLGMTPCQRIG